jgi:hypothetical protein
VIIRLDVHEHDRPDGPSSFRVVATERSGATREALDEHEPLRSALAELHERRRVEEVPKRSSGLLDDARIPDVLGWLLATETMYPDAVTRARAREVRAALRGGPLLADSREWLRARTKDDTENGRRAACAWRVLSRSGKIDTRDPKIE